MAGKAHIEENKRGKKNITDIVNFKLSIKCHPCIDELCMEIFSDKKELIHNSRKVKIICNDSSIKYSNSCS